MFQEIMVVTWYVLVQGTLILSASTEPVHFSMTDSEQFALILIWISLGTVELGLAVACSQISGDVCPLVSCTLSLKDG